MNKKISSILKWLISVLYVVLMSGIITTNLFCDIDYTLKKEFLVKNLTLLCFALCLMTILIILFDKGFFRGIFGRSRRINIILMSVFLFAIQGIIFHEIYFLSSDWDPFDVLINAQMIAKGETGGLYNEYFSHFTNNQWLVFIISLVCHIQNFFGVESLQSIVWILIIIQCILSTTTGFLLYRIIEDYTENSFFSWLGWGFYIILIGLSGWNMVTYTDAMGLIYPTAILRLYQTMKNKHYFWSKCIGLITLGYWGYKMKPTVIVIVIAIVFIELIDWIENMNKEKTVRIGRIVLLIFVFVFLYTNIFRLAIHSTGLKIDPELDVGPLHMILIGINDEKDGYWNDEEFHISVDIDDKEERTKAQMTAINDRMQKYGFRGFLKHMLKKSLLIFNDGTFAWGDEGGFFDIEYGNAQSIMHRFWKNLYYREGSNYSYLSTIEQAFWLLSIFLALGIAKCPKSKFVNTIILSLVGIILFNYTFEARARYLLLYVPIVIIAAVFSSCNLYFQFKQKLMDIDKERE